MQIAPDFLLVGLLSPKTFTLRNMPPTLSFCAEPKGEVAESIIQKITLALLERRERRRRWVRARQKHFLTHLFRPETHLLPKEKGYLRFLKMWILQLRASPACRMTWAWGDRMKEETSSLKVFYKRNKMNRSCSISNSWINQKTMNLVSSINHCT